MKIYMAGIYAGGRGAALSASPHLRVTRMVKYPHLLESFHYMSPSMVRDIREHKDTIFLDSGAFSMFTQGAKVDLKKYAQFIHDHPDIIEVASNLDAIGEGKEELTYANQKALEGMGVKIQPVHHVRDADHWLKRYMDEGYDYIFLGGMVPESTQTLQVWLDRIWDHYLTDEQGRARVKVHGFGLTTLSLMFRYPWHSVDSTSWVMVSRFGSIFLDFPQPDGTVKDYKIDFSEHSSKKTDITSWHYLSLTRDEQRRVDARLEELEAARTDRNPELEAELEAQTGYKQGYNPEALAKSYGWRDHMNVNYFRRAMKRRVDTFLVSQETLF